jgi:hypothetical protein
MPARFQGASKKNGRVRRRPQPIVSPAFGPFFGSFCPSMESRFSFG